VAGVAGSGGVAVQPVSHSSSGPTPHVSHPVIVVVW